MCEFARITPILAWLSVLCRGRMTHAQGQVTMFIPALFRSSPRQNGTILYHYTVVFRNFACLDYQVVGCRFIVCYLFPRYRKFNECAGKCLDSVSLHALNFICRKVALFTMHKEREDGISCLHHWKVKEKSLIRGIFFGLLATRLAILFCVCANHCD